MHGCWEQWSRERTSSRRLGSGRPRITTEREDHRIRRTAVTHRTVFAANIRAAVGTTMTQRTVRTRLLQGQLRARSPVSCILLTPSHCRLCSSGVKPELSGGRSGDLLCFLMKAGSALAPVMAVCWSKEGQENATKLLAV